DMLAGALNIKDSGGNSHTITLGTANSTDTLANLASTINAAGYGITATVNANEVNGDTQGTVLTLTSASSTASVSGTNVTDASTASTTVTTTAPTSGTTSTAPGALTLATIGVNAANQTLTGTLVLDKAQAATGTSAFANSLGTGANLTTGAGAINLGVTGVTDTLANLANFINQNQSAGSNIQAVLSNGGKTLTVVNTTTFTPGAAATYATVTGVGANAVNSANADALTGVPTAAGSSFSATIGTLTADSTSSKFANTGTLNIGSNAGISLGVTGSTDTLTNLAQTINTGNYGVTATLNTAGTQLTFTSANSANTFNVTGATYSGTGGAIYATTNVASQNQIGVLNLSNTGANITTASVLAVGDKISFNNGEHVYTVNSTDGNQLGQIATAISNQGWGITATAATVSGGTYTTATLTFASNSANSQGISATFVQGAAEAANDVISMTSDTPSVDASHYYSVGITGKVTDTTIINANGTNGGTLNTGIVADSNGSTGVATMSYSDAAGQSLSASDLSTQSNAEAALTNLNSAIADVAAQDGYIGAQINTLSAVSNVMSTQQENLESAQNAVQATDYASASSNMSKYEILSQTGISALAQANSVQQEVTKLLQ
ncbi:MAG: flagellin, partial [Alphaproteobacteria bacterium]